MVKDILNSIDGLGLWGTLPILLFFMVFGWWLSLLYNGIGLYLAATGVLTPVVCAVLMPTSSLTILFSSAAGSWLGARKYLKGE